jgi:predicted dinucleotide-binding enzyme
MSEDRLRVVSGAGQVGNALAAYLAGQGTAVRAVSRHRPDVLADVGQGTGPGVHGRWA